MLEKRNFWIIFHPRPLFMVVLVFVNVLQKRSNSKQETSRFKFSDILSKSSEISKKHLQKMLNEQLQIIKDRQEQ